MKKLSFLLKASATLMLSFLLINCTSAQKREVRDVSGFTVVSLSVSADIYLSQAASYKVEMEGDADYLEKIETVVDGNVLKIKNKDHFNFEFNNKKMKIHISMPQVNGLTISGSGDIFAQTAIKTDDLKVKISGSGNVKIDNLSVKNLDMAISGSGDIEMSGTDVAESASYSISGSGDIDNQGLQCKKVNIHVSGSGDVKVWAVDELDAKVSGSGDVYYKGRPIIDAKTSGSGGIHHL
ncbi:MAG: DUF2807 domain-containing protein [Bacteroidales bacterium]|nr:MAG: DUF2807 domain-containing protein [Bacteroidales bacterium]